MATDATKARLLEAAGEEFAEKGFDGATVRSILNRAGVRNIAAINYYFGDKEGLYAQALIEAHRCGIDLPPEAVAFEGEPADQLRRFIRHFLGHMLAIGEPQVGWHQALMLREMIRPSAASDVLVREVIRPKFERLLKILRGIHPAAEGRRLHATAFSIVGQCLHYRMARIASRKLVGEEGFARLLDLDFLTDHIASFSLAALGLAPPLDLGDGAGNGRGNGKGAAGAARGATS